MKRRNRHRLKVLLDMQPAEVLDEGFDDIFEAEDRVREIVRKRGYISTESDDYGFDES